MREQGQDKGKVQGRDHHHHLLLLTVKYRAPT
jgi:hypothetical protein